MTTDMIITCDPTETPTPITDAWVCDWAHCYEDRTHPPRSRNYGSLYRSYAATLGESAMLDHLQEHLGEPVEWACCYDYESVQGCVESGCLFVLALNLDTRSITRVEMIDLQADPRRWDGENWRLFPVGAHGRYWRGSDSCFRTEEYLSDRWESDIGTVVYCELEPRRDYSGDRRWKMVFG